MDHILKYPRTPHLQGSRLQPGDVDHDQVDYRDLAGKYIVVEEKIDGANSGISFSSEAELWLQSRGHYLTGGGREKHFDLLKRWAAAKEVELYELLGDRFLMYGEWMASKHSVFYDRLQHLFYEFDIYDKKRGIFLSTAARHQMLKDSPVVSVPVLYAGIAPKTFKELLEIIAVGQQSVRAGLPDEWAVLRYAVKFAKGNVESLIGPSIAKSIQWRENLRLQAERLGLDVERVMQETNLSDQMEGLYIKIEDGDETVDRLKWVRSGFLQTIMDNDSHWLSRPIVPNLLAPGVDIFA